MCKSTRLVVTERAKSIVARPSASLQRRILRGWSHGAIPSYRSRTHARRWRPLLGLPIEGALLMLAAFVRSIVALVFNVAVLLFLASAGARSRRPGSTPDLVQMITPTPGATVPAHPDVNRSEERRVGKACKAGWA